MVDQVFEIYLRLLILAATAALAVLFVMQVATGDLLALVLGVLLGPVILYAVVLAIWKS